MTSMLTVQKIYENMNLFISSFFDDSFDSLSLSLSLSLSFLLALSMKLLQKSALLNVQRADLL